MNFGQAIEAMKAGKRVSRSGWNGKGMWVARTPGSIVTLDKCREGAARLYADDLLTNDAMASHPLPESRSIAICGHIDMKAADGTLVIGWLASQADMLADDWSEVGASPAEGDSSQSAR